MLSPWLIPLAAIWAPVVYLLGAQWSYLDQYNYGWAVPGLCALLASQKASSPALPSATAPDHKKSALALLVVAGLVYWIMRVLQEANPIWRVASYGLALAAVAMTLLVIYLTQGRARLAHFFFPVAFFLVAVPWPTPLEGATIQTLTRFNAGLVMEVLGFLGIPALLHGNVIEISSGMVGFDEACSGIRSLQATVMIALFFGAFYQLTWKRRLGLLAAGPVISLGFNLARTLTLVLVAAHAGLPAMEQWHDPTGVALLLGCFFSLWFVTLRLARRSPEVRGPTGESRRPEAAKSEVRSPAPSGPVVSGPVVSARAFRVSSFAWPLVLWSLTVALSTEAWFRSHEARGNGGDRAKGMGSWSAQWPRANPTLRTNLIPPVSLRILHCDEHDSASWSDDMGVYWQAFYLRWLPAESFYGRTQVARSKSHNPAICLTGTGMTLKARLDPVTLSVNPDPVSASVLSLTFERFVFAVGDRNLYVFFSQTEDLTAPGQANLRTSHLARLRAALTGSRNYGERNFEVALTGPDSPEAALALFQARLPSLVRESTGY